MMKVLVATEKPFAPIAVEGIRKETEAAGNQLVLLEKYTDKAQLLAAVADADALIVRSDKVDAEVIEAAKQLKIVVRAGAGYDNVDLAAATAKNIVVENTPGQNSNAVAELIFGLLLYANRAFFSGKAGTELKGKKIGLLSYGNIARCAARIAKGFGMEVYAASRKQDFVKEGVAPCASAKELFETCDIISLHTPATPETKRSINAELLQGLKKGAVIVNTARKEIIDEEALLALLAARPDVKYLTDVMPDAVEKFAALEGQYYATAKKMGAQTQEANINAGIAAAEQITAFFQSGDTTFKVN